MAYTANGGEQSVALNVVGGKAQGYKSETGLHGHTKFADLQCSEDKDEG